MERDTQSKSPPQSSPQTEYPLTGRTDKYEDDPIEEDGQDKASPDLEQPQIKKEDPDNDIPAQSLI